MTKKELAREISKFTKKQGTAKEVSAHNTGELKKICDAHKWNVFGVPHKNINNHSYTVGSLYQVSTLHDDEDSGGLKMCIPGDKSSTGNWILFEEVTLYVPAATSKPALNGKIIDRLVISDEYRKLILDTVKQSNPDAINKIFVEWGFEETIEKGKGIIMLLYGPPGTGKSMCAEGIAEMLEKDFIILNSGSIQSNIPGQTERNIADAFKKAGKDDLILILDECDSLVYNRDEVGAILAAEINALLTEIERFEGICILTTNRSERLDPALERRVCLKLKFNRPDESTRIHIWKKLIPKQCPLGEDVKIDELSKYDLSGGQIKNALLTAARMAVGRNADKLEMVDMLIGVNAEKLGEKMWDTTDKYKAANSGQIGAAMEKSAGLIKTTERISTPHV